VNAVGTFLTDADLFPQKVVITNSPRNFVANAVA
jgi:hypothetical protein